MALEHDKEELQKEGSGQSVDSFFDREIPGIYNEIEAKKGGEQPKWQDILTHLKQQGRDDLIKELTEKKQVQSRQRWTQFRNGKIEEFNQQENTTVARFLEEMPLELYDDPKKAAEKYKSETRFKTAKNAEYFQEKLETRKETLLLRQASEFGQEARKLGDKDIMKGMIASFDAEKSVATRDHYINGKDNDGIRVKVGQYIPALREIALIEKSLPRQLEKFPELKQRYEQESANYDVAKRIYDDNFISPRAYLKTLQEIQGQAGIDTQKQQLEHQKQLEDAKGKIGNLSGPVYPETQRPSEAEFIAGIPTLAQLGIEAEFHGELQSLWASKTRELWEQELLRQEQNQEEETEEVVEERKEGEEEIEEKEGVTEESPEEEETEQQQKESEEEKPEETPENLSQTKQAIDTALRLSTAEIQKVSVDKTEFEGKKRDKVADILKKNADSKEASKQLEDHTQKSIDAAWLKFESRMIAKTHAQMKSTIAIAPYEEAKDVDSYRSWLEERIPTLAQFPKDEPLPTKLQWQLELRHEKNQEALDDSYKWMEKTAAEWSPERNFDDFESFEVAFYDAIDNENVVARKSRNMKKLLQEKWELHQTSKESEVKEEEQETQDTQFEELFGSKGPEIQRRLGLDETQAARANERMEFLLEHPACKEYFRQKQRALVFGPYILAGCASLKDADFFRLFQNLRQVTRPEDVPDFFREQLEENTEFMQFQTSHKQAGEYFVTATEEPEEGAESEEEEIIEDEEAQEKVENEEIILETPEGDTEEIQGEEELETTEEEIRETDEEDEEMEEEVGEEQEEVDEEIEEIIEDSEEIVEDTEEVENTEEQEEEDEEMSDDKEDISEEEQEVEENEELEEDLQEEKEEVDETEVEEVEEDTEEIVEDVEDVDEDSEEITDEAEDMDEETDKDGEDIEEETEDAEENLEELEEVDEDLQEEQEEGKDSLSVIPDSDPESPEEGGETDVEEVYEDAEKTEEDLEEVEEQEESEVLYMTLFSFPVSIDTILTQEEVDGKAVETLDESEESEEQTDERSEAEELLRNHQMYIPPSRMVEFIINKEESEAEAGFSEKVIVHGQDSEIEVLEEMKIILDHKEFRPYKSALTLGILLERFAYSAQINASQISVNTNISSQYLDADVLNHDQFCNDMINFWQSCQKKDPEIHNILFSIKRITGNNSDMKVTMNVYGENQVFASSFLCRLENVEEQRAA